MLHILLSTVYLGCSVDDCAQCSDVDTCTGCDPGFYLEQSGSGTTCQGKAT